MLVRTRCIAPQRRCAMPVNSISALKSKFSQATEDKVVTTAEVEALIELVKDGGGVTNSERRQIREKFIQKKDLFEEAAKTRMDDFISKEIPGLLIDDPVIGDGEGKTDLPD